MIRKNIFKIILFLILILASLTRFWDLSTYPKGLNADEAAIGYNVYSLLETGKDEHGNSWPLHFKSFGDYKPGGYFYLVLPFEKVLGMNELAIRLPSAILGVLAVLLIYLLVKDLFAIEGFALISAFFLAISPWHIHFSRGGWEVNAATTFILLGTWLFIKGLRNPKYLLFSVFAYTYSLYTYHSARIVVPLLVLGLFLFYRKALFAHLKWLIVSVGLGLILLIPIALSFFSPAGASRFAGVGLLADTGPYWRVNELRGEHQNWTGTPVKLLHNRVFVYGLDFLENYFDHFNGEFLFISGDVIERNRVPETGQMYLFDIPLVVLGFYFFFKRRPEGWKVILLWLLVAPIPAAMTFQTPHALRAHNMVIPMIMISAYGFWNSLLWIKSKKEILKILFYCFIFLLFIWSFVRYLHEYYVHYPQTYPAAWEYGFKEAVDYIKPIAKNYDKILVTDKYDQPYILFLFYLKYPPETFQKEVILTPRDKFGFSTVEDFDNYHFGSINWDEAKKYGSVLIIGAPSDIPEGAGIIKVINFPGGEPAFKFGAQ